MGLGTRLGNCLLGSAGHELSGAQRALILPMLSWHPPAAAVVAGVVTTPLASSQSAMSSSASFASLVPMRHCVRTFRSAYEIKLLWEGTPLRLDPVPLAILSSALFHSIFHFSIYQKMKNGAQTIFHFLNPPKKKKNALHSVFHFLKFIDKWKNDLASKFCLFIIAE